MSESGSLSDLEESVEPVTSPAPPNDASTDVGTAVETEVETDVDNTSGTEANSDDATVDEGPLTEEDKEMEEGEEPNENEKKIAALVCIICCFICCVIIGLLAFFLTPDTDPLARAQTDPFTDSPTPLTLSPTESPTPEPTDSPTVPGATRRPTLNPTAKPTPAPTLPPFEIPTKISRLPCSQIRVTENATAGNFGNNNFKLQTLRSGVEVCGDTYGPDPDKPNRNPWSVAIGRRNCPKFSFTEGLAICDVVGARWCTVEEFDEEIAHGTGCGGDREMVYTDSNCSTPDGKSGKIMFDVGLRDSRRPFYECESDLTRTSLARCCGDVY